MYSSIFLEIRYLTTSVTFIADYFGDGYLLGFEIIHCLMGLKMKALVGIGQLTF